VLRDEMAVSGRCVASESVQHTVQSVPVKKAQEPMLLAVAVPGESWRLLPQAVLADRAVLETEGLLPKALQAATVAASLGEVLEEMEAQGIRFPAIETRDVKRNPSKP
jgi:hypothetical protein